MRGALDWTRGAGRPPAAPPERADVVIPVHGAPEVLGPCLASVEAHTGLARHGVVVILDGPQDESVESLVRAFATAHPDTRVLRNETRRGFVASVDRGMRETSGDVVLLNTDSVVTARWLDKLIDAAYADGDTATVTPLSNNATLASVPRGWVENLLPAGYDVDAFAALVERVSVRERPFVPTGVGFCLYIRRVAWDDAGGFDVERFGTGYGEENDFCLRALARGWRHVVDDATFVLHAGHRSFGSSREQHQRRGRAMLARLHPRYDATIAAAMRHDPLEGVRARIAAALGVRAASPGRLRIVHVVHGWPPFQHAGTELYAYWLAHAQAAAHDVAVYARDADPHRADGEAVEYFDREVRIRLITNHFTARDPLRRNAIRDRALERDFARFLREEKPDLVHIHHLAGHTFSLARVARGFPLVMQLHDWWFVCARVNRLHRDGVRCSGPAPAKCADCATLTRIPPARITNRFVHWLRRRAARTALREADAYIAGSEAIRADYTDVIPPATPFHVMSYGIAMEPSHAPRGPVERPIRFGYVGSVAPHKGVHVAAEAMRELDPRVARLHVWGDASADPGYVASMNATGSVVFEGTFAEEDKERVFASIDVLLVPSIGLESFGLAPREAMASGVPVIATEGGALDAMFAPGACGAFVPPGDVAALRALLQVIVAQPEIVDRWAAQLPRPKSIAEHAVEIDAIYRSVLEARR